jgi:hypothetical protein
MSDDFLSRWSRRKLEARHPPERPATTRPAPEEPEITPEELAALPKPEEMTAETDLAAFFRKGVPEMLRNAALRRMWALDPAIREFEGPARDYAWDWNIPGGVPGNGPLAPTDDVESMLRQVFGEGRGDSPEASGDSARPDKAGRAIEESSPSREKSVASQQAEPAPLQPQNDPVRLSAKESNSEAKVSAAPQSIADYSTPPRQRRHGGARPV